MSDTWLDTPQFELLMSLAEKDQTTFQQQMASTFYRAAGYLQRQVYDKKRNEFLMQSTVSLADCPPAHSHGCTAIKPSPCKKKNKQESKMFYDEDTDDYVERTEAERTKDYLFTRLRNEHSSKQYDLRKAFYMIDDDAPVTPAELVKRIQDGKFILNDKTKDEYQGCYSAQYITWRDPAKPADTESFEAANDKLTKAYCSAKDEIKVFAPEKGLETLKAFQAATFH